MAIATVVGDFLTQTVPMPMAVLLFFGLLIVLPTGDMIRLSTVILENVTTQHEERKKGEMQENEN